MKGFETGGIPVEMQSRGLMELKGREEAGVGAGPLSNPGEAGIIAASPNSTGAEKIFQAQGGRPRTPEGRSEVGEILTAAPVVK